MLLGLSTSSGGFNLLRSGWEFQAMLSRQWCSWEEPAFRCEQDRVTPHMGQSTDISDMDPEQDFGFIDEQLPGGFRT